MNTSRRKSLALLIVALAAELFTLPVWAQSTQLEEVVVTARKRDESFRDVPVTVDVLTEAQIQSAGIQDPRDYVAMVPNMTMVEVQNIGNAFITIRGISQARNSEPSVAVLVDGVLETNPYEFNQELIDVRQIEVLKGPQGALYGRNAIGGAIIIHTKDPPEKFEGQAMFGVGNDDAYRGELALGGPMNSDGSLRYRASFAAYSSDGYLQNVYLNRKADPVREYSGRLRFLWKASDAVTADLRVYANRYETTAYYYIIPRADEANPFSSFTTPPNANDVTSPIQVNNEGSDNRDIFDTALKLDFDVGGHGTITSISDYTQTKEIDTGDAYDFRPIDTSIYKTLLGFDLNQSQFINVKAWSQELRYTSNKIGNFSWIGGVYYVHTERFISTGNMVDTGNGVFPVYETPRIGGLNPSATFLADSQNNNAWAVFADGVYEFTPQWELDAAIRYDEDTRENTTRTPQAFLAQLMDPTAFTGEVRKHTWSEPQPKLTLRYKLTSDITFYGGWSRGFRSGGFNQTGVGAAARNSVPPVLGVNDLFNAEVADTAELGMKSEWLDRRLSANLALFYTKSTNGYFFVFLPATSTQNLGNLDAKYHGGELELNARPLDRLQVYANFGYTKSKITAMADPTVIGNEAPLVSRYTINAGFQYTAPMSDTLNAMLRFDFQSIGRTWWDPYNVTSRDPVNLIDLRAGFEAGNWSLIGWSKNLTNKIYNAEFSPGGFLWRAPPQRFGVDFNVRF